MMALEESENGDASRLAPERFTPNGSAENLHPVWRCDRRPAEIASMTDATPPWLKALAALADRFGC